MNALDLNREMQALALIRKTREYLDYVETHINNIDKAWREVQIKCKGMRFIYDDYVFHTLDAEVKAHDVSKLSEHEFIQYRKAFYPADGEPEYDMSDAWEHHKKHNPHHWEKWTKLSGHNPYLWEINCAHMVIDWLAMSYEFGDSPREFYKRKKESVDIPNYAVEFIYEIFDCLEAS